MGQYVVHSYPEIGITEHVGRHAGFPALVKERYSDFVVHEISEDGSIIRLTDMSCPAPDNERHAMLDVTAENNLREVISLEMYERISSMSSNQKDRTSVIDVDVTTMDKEARTKIHKSVAQLFPSLNTFTHDGKDGHKLISISRSKQYQGNTVSWKYPHPYTHFTVYQENRGTYEVVSHLAKALRKSAKGFFYAGNKDKRGISSQRMSCFKLDPRKLLAVNGLVDRMTCPVLVGNISFESKPLELGHLQGNHFQMVLRDVVGEVNVIEESLNNVKDSGFINYFGNQRFGSGYTRSDVVGRFILKRDWKAAVEAILTPKWRDMGSQNGSFNEAMTKWQETRDAKAIFDKFKWKFNTEGTVLRELAKSSDNYRNALLAVPRNNRCLYLHAYQSYVWNRLASWRIKEHGLSVVPGDLVVLNSSAAPVAEVQTEENEECKDDDDEPVVDEVMKESGKLTPVLATQDMVSQVSIYDVVIPLPCTRAMRRTPEPASPIEAKMREIMKEDGTDECSHNPDDTSFMMFGGYRKLLAKPGDMRWSLVKYDDEKVRLVQTDMEKLNGVNEKTALVENGAKTAVVVEFTLPSSSYATMCVREVMKR